MTLSLQSGDAILLAAAAFCCYFLLRPIVSYFVDPLGLRKYPAPSLLAATTPLWLMKETWMQRRSRSVHNEFKKHGGPDVLRVGPNQLIFNIPQAVTDIYGHLAARRLVKDVFYDKIAADQHDIVNTRDHEDHAHRRKYLSNSFALKTVVDMEPVIRDNFGRLLGRIDEHVAETAEETHGEKTPFDIRQW
jgi:benzoate 4-monooxygenase